MSYNRNIPEPTLEEHALIEANAPVPELSAGFRSRVLSECAVAAAASQRAFRLRVAGVTGTVCCLGLLMFLALPQQPLDVSPLVEAPEEPVSPRQIHYSPGQATDSPGLALDAAKPPRVESDRSQMDDMIEDLTNRKKVFNANMLPQL